MELAERGSYAAHPGLGQESRAGVAAPGSAARPKRRRPIMPRWPLTGLEAAAPFIYSTTGTRYSLGIFSNAFQETYAMARDLGQRVPWPQQDAEFREQLLAALNPQHSRDRASGRTIGSFSSPVSPRGRLPSEELAAQPFKERRNSRA